MSPVSSYGAPFSRRCRTPWWSVWSLMWFHWRYLWASPYSVPTQCYRGYCSHVEHYATPWNKAGGLVITSSCDLPLGVMRVDPGKLRIYIYINIFLQWRSEWCSCKYIYIYIYNHWLLSLLVYFKETMYILT